MRHNVRYVFNDAGRLPVKSWQRTQRASSQAVFAVEPNSTGFGRALALAIPVSALIWAIGAMSFLSALR